MQQPEARLIAKRLSTEMAAGCLGARVERLHRLVVREFDRRLRPIGLSLQQLQVLSTLTLCARPIRPTMVADLLAIERSTMSRNLAVLTERGLVHSPDASATGRSLTVAVTEAGNAKLAEAATAWADAQAVLTTALGDVAPVLDDWLAALTV